MDFFFSPLLYDPFPALLFFSRRNFDFLGTSPPCFPLLPGAPKPSACSFSAHRFILDAGFRIESLTSATDLLLGEAASRFSGIPFSAVLGAESQPLWEAVTGQLQDGRGFHFTFALTFVTPGLQLVPALCTLARLYPTEKLLADVVLFPDLGLHGERPAFSKNTNLGPRVHAYLLSRLDTRLPTLRGLARLFGTNEFLLKSAFRQAYGTSIYRFHKEERLQRAYSMLLDTGLPFSEIATACGFENYPHFSKAFKKRFGLSPRGASKR